MRDPAYLKYNYEKIGRDPKISLPAAIVLWILAASFCWVTIALMIYWF